MEVLEKTKKLGIPLTMTIGILLVGIVGWLDYVTGYEFSFSLFYLFPVFLVTWSTSKRYGSITALLSAVVWLLADVMAGNTYSHPFLYYWSMFIRFGFYIIVVFLLSTVQRSLEHEKELARTDFLTGAVNSRQFNELLDAEVIRFNRYAHPFTLVYLDVDNFKQVNDRFGHKEGDRALSTIVQYTRENLRKSDTIARLGGDEFAILLPETQQEAGRAVMRKVQVGLLKQMEINNWPITFSIGALTCMDSAWETDQLISFADRLMYSVKQNGKNSIAFLTLKNHALITPPEQAITSTTILFEKLGEI